MLEKLDSLDKENKIKESLFSRSHFSDMCIKINLEKEESQVKDKEILKNMIGKLPAKQRQAMELFYLESMSLKKAAEQANCSVKALQCRLSRALKSIKSMHIKCNARKTRIF